MTTEEKARAYDEALIKGSRLWESDIITRETYEFLFPKLAESEDEKIREELVDFLKEEEAKADITSKRSKTLCKYVAWLEKQGEQKPIDKAEPKFKVGDWIYHEMSGNTFHINKIENDLYVSDEGATISLGRQNNWRLWTIEDAKPGDMLNADGAPFIYKKHDKDYVYFYCGVNLADEFIEVKGFTWNNNNKVYPATKEQRDLLFQKMKEAGYEWDADKKELKKIEDTPLVIDEGKDEMDRCFTEMVSEYYTKQKPAWSEEDEKILNSLIISLARIGASTRTDSTSINYTFSKEIDWLKSLKDRYTWKPSDEQMQALKNAVNDALMQYGFRGSLIKEEVTRKYAETIESLYNDLKKLKE